MNRICIVFYKEDINKFKSRFKDSSSLIFVGLVKSDNCNVINIWDTCIDEGLVSTKVKFFFKELGRKYGLEINGYANNFFQSVIVIIIKYIASIDKILERYDSVELVFPNNVLFSTGQPNYYLAEYESQGVKLYDREGVFFKILYNYYKDKELNISFLSSKVSLQYLFNPLRIFAVFVYKFFKDINDNSKDYNLNNDKGSILTYIVRSYSQGQYLKKILKNNGFYNKVIVVNNFIESNNFNIINNFYSDLDNVSVISFKRSCIKKILIIYFKNLLNILAVKKIYISIGEININATQSVKEIFAMYSELLLYKDKLSKGFAKIGSKKKDILFSLEQKSPHAYIDGLVSKNLNSFCVQVMQCDQDGMKIPYPIVGNLFIPISREKYIAFKNAWRDEEDRLFFPGTINTILCDINVKYKHKVCYFSNFFDNEKCNIDAVNELIRISNKNNFTFIIKLHPRDNGAWLKKCMMQKNILIYRDNEISKETLCTLFDIAIGGFSAIFIYLLSIKKKYIILNFKDSILKVEDIDYIDCDYRAVVDNLQEMEYWIKNDLLLEVEFKLFCERYFGANGNQCTSEEYMKKIIKRLLEEQ